MSGRSEIGTGSTKDARKKRKRDSESDPVSEQARIEQARIAKTRIEQTRERMTRHSPHPFNTSHTSDAPDLLATVAFELEKQGISPDVALSQHHLERQPPQGEPSGSHHRPGAPDNPSSNNDDSFGNPSSSSEMVLDDLARARLAKRVGRAKPEQLVLIREANKGATDSLRPDTIHVQEDELGSTRNKDKGHEIPRGPETSVAGSSLQVGTHLGPPPETALTSDKGKGSAIEERTESTQGRFSEDQLKGHVEALIAELIADSNKREKPGSTEIAKRWKEGNGLTNDEITTVSRIAIELRETGELKDLAAALNINTLQASKKLQGIARRSNADITEKKRQSKKKPEYRFRNAERTNVRNAERSKRIQDLE